MPLRSYAGPGLGRPSGWECPKCGAPNATARGTQCVSCGFPPDAPKDGAPPVLTTDRNPEGAEGSPLDTPLGSNAAVDPKALEAAPAFSTLPVDGAREQLIRRYKLIEYYGPADWVELGIKRSLFGAKAMGTHGYLIGTEVSEAAIASQTELLQRVTEARSQDPTWEAAGWAANGAVEERPAPSTVFQQTMRAMEEVMEKDPRYARTMAAALETWARASVPARDDNPEQWLNSEELNQVVHILTLIVPTDKEPQPA